MDLKPADLDVRILSTDVALITFHLSDSALFGRRTVVFKKSPIGWKIVHIHASNFPLPADSSR